MARPRQSMTFTFDLANHRQMLAAFRRLPKEAGNELRTAALEISRSMSARVRSAGQAEGRQAGAVAATVKARRDRVPVVVVGGTRGVGRHGTPASALLFGSEFGARADQRKGAPWGYLPRRSNGTRRGARGYWVYPTVDAMRPEISDRWNEAAQRIIDSFRIAPPAGGSGSRPRSGGGSGTGA